jgi:hypothetical protein
MTSGGEQSGGEQGSGAPDVVKPGPGMHVMHKYNEAWGQGMIISAQGSDVRVLFTSHPARKPVLVPVKALTIIRAGKWTEAAAAVNERANRPPSKPSGGPRTPRKYATTNQDEAVTKFLADFPGGFTGQKFTDEQRAPRWSAHQAFVELLGGGTLRKLLDEGQAQEAARRAAQVLEKLKLLSVFEKARLRKILQADDTAVAYLKALADLLDAPELSDAVFAPYAKVVGTLSEESKQRIDTWPAATAFPFLAQPERHFFLKPVATQAAAERLKVPLQYQSALNWTTYRKALDLAAELAPLLAPHGCRDLVDVQAFVSLTA